MNIPQFPQRAVLLCWGLERGLGRWWEQPILIVDINHLGGGAIIVRLTLLLMNTDQQQLINTPEKNKPPKLKSNPCALTAAAASTRGRLLQCLKMSAFSKSLSVYRKQKQR
jgi:hypothetical protein